VSVSVVWCGVVWCSRAAALQRLQDGPLLRQGQPHPTLPYPALPCPALPCPALPCPALPFPSFPCPALPITYIYLFIYLFILILSLNTLQDCQQIAWIDGHKKDCKKLAKLNEGDK
jgi:hypothetical protein